MAAELTGTGEENDPRFGIPGGAQLWHDTSTGAVYIVYVVPGTEDDPVYMRWTVPSMDDAQSFFGPDQPVVFDYEFDGGSDTRFAESIDFGSSDDIANTSKAPFDSWASTLETEAVSQPWILDDDYQQLLAMSIIEGRPLTEAELATTQWYQTHTDAQRDWMFLQASNPAQAEQTMADNRAYVTTLMQNAGVSRPDERLVGYMADNLTTGEWSLQTLNREIENLADPYYADRPLDAGLQAFIDDHGITYDVNQDMETEVRNIVTRWLGTNFGQWDNDTVAEWAGILRNETDGRERLEEMLKDQKMALFPEYDREATYDAIAAPWKNMMRNMWGRVPQDSDTTLHSIIRMNDAGDAGRFLTEEGLNKGNDTVVANVQQKLNASFGGQGY
jgi:hypothetical protein